MCTMYVVGVTSPREVIVASTDREFIIDEYLKIKDELHGDFFAEVIKTNAYSSLTKDIFPQDSGVFENMMELEDIDKNKTIYFAVTKLLTEIPFPITPLSKVVEPIFEEIKDILIQQEESNGFTLGVIQGTEKIQSDLPEKYKNISPLFDQRKGVIPQTGIPFILDYYSLREYPHIALFGGSGSGKTFGLRVICEEIMRKRIPGIIFDPHYELSFQEKMEGIPSEIQEDFLKQYETFQIGENVGINFSELQTEELISLLEFVSNLTEPMKSAIEQLHKKNDSFTTLNNRVSKLIKAYQYYEKTEREQRRLGDLPDEAVLLYKKYSNKIAGLPTLQAISWRLEQLNSIGIFNCDIDLVVSCMMKRKLAVIRGKQRHLIMLASYLIGKTYKRRRMYKDWEQTSMYQSNDGYEPEKFPPFFIIMDESHQFAPNGQYSTPTKRIIREISQEARKYGVFLILGTQRPALLDTTIASQMNTKVVFRTGNESDIKMIQTETNLNEDQMKRLPDLTSGNAFISSATLSKVFYIRFRATKTVSPHALHPFDELDDFDDSSKLQEVLTKYLPISKTTLPKKHAEINSEVGKYVSQEEIFEALDDLAIQKKIKKEESPFGTIYQMN